MSKYQQITLKKSDDVSLNAYECAPKGKAKAVVQINHGLAEHAGRYQRFQEALAASGYASCAHDHRGHGKTIAKDASRGSFAKKDGWQKVISDVDFVNDHLREQYPDTPIITFGHSMGATIATTYLLQHADKINAAAIWNGAMPNTLAGIMIWVMKFQRAVRGSDAVSTLAKLLTFDAWNKEFKPTRTEFDWLSRDEAEVDKYVNDPDCGFDVTIGLWLDLLGGLMATKDANAMNALPKDMPIHILNGDKDPCTFHGKAVSELETRMQKAGLTKVSTTVLQDTRHESLNELNRDETTKAFVDWLEVSLSGRANFCD